MADYKRLFAGFVLALIVLTLMFVLIAAADEIRVCPYGCEYSSIQAAVDSAKQGDEIAVESGTYAGNLIAGKTVNLQGHDSGWGWPVLAGMITAAADKGALSGFELAGHNRTDDSCILNIVGPISIYLNNIPGSKAICSESSGLWNSSSPITYQFESRILRSRMGNYWADYDGEDKNRDGIGDQPKVIDEENSDYYPLIQPIESYRTRITGEEEKRLELIKARLNEPFTIALNSNPTTGYKWYADYDYHLLVLENEKYEIGSSEALGAGGFSVFTFKPLKPGRTTISLVYKRPWENIVADARTYHVLIDA
jgi:inhibitor of cysteine peptidase